MRVTPIALVIAASLPVAFKPHPVLAQEPSAQSRFVQVRGADLVAPDGSVLVTRGIGLGNWLVPEGYMWRFEKGASSPRHIEQVVAGLVGPDEARSFWRAWRDAYVTRDDLALLKRMGFDTVRVPFTYRQFMSDDDETAWRDDGFVPLDRVVQWSKELGLWVVLDMHGAPGGQTGSNIDDGHGTPWLFESGESQERMIRLWTRIAERYKDEPAVLGYELLNEPIATFLDWKDRYNAGLEPLYKRVTAAVRAVDPNHVIILGGAQWNNEFSVFGPPFAANLVYAFHKYWSDVTDASLKPYLDFRDRHRVPIWLGETGENDDAWIASMARMSEKHGIGWAFWPYKKMDATSSVVSFARPAGWDRIAAFAAANPFDYEAGRAVRPAPAEARAILKELLANVTLAKCRVNDGYVKALRPKP
jgi:aryl-phospho-beta-D-glucosidase BglC (GH1 family)